MTATARCRRAVVASVLTLAFAAPATASATPDQRSSPPPAETTTPLEALLIGDSVMNGLAQTYGASARALLAARHSFLLETAGCRRLITTSCRILPAPAPTNALTVLKARAGAYNRVLVIGAGYNDSTTGSSGVGAAVDAIVAEARRQGIGAIIWLTYREAGPSQSRFRAHNTLLRSKLAVYPDLHLADWATVSARMPTSWFSSDGIHLGSSAASGMAKLIADTIDAVPSLRDRCAPWNWTGFAAPTAAPLVGAAHSGGVHPLATPVRVADTRSLSGKIGARRVLPVIIAGANGVPADAAAAIVTVIAVRPCANLAVTAYPCEGGPPLASMLNAAAGAVVAGSAIVRLGSGAVCLLASQPTDLVVDLTGWVGGNGARTDVIDPQRLIDTRTGQPQATAAPQAQLSAGEHLTVDLDGVSGINATTAAVTVNITAFAPAAAGFLTVSPGSCGATKPLTSTINVSPGRDMAAATTVGLLDTRLCLYSSVATDVAIDLQAIHGVSGGDMWVAAPIRLADTRGGTLVGPGHVLEIDPAAPPSGAAISPPGGSVGAVLSLVAVSPAAATAVNIRPCAAEAGAPQLLATTTIANRVTVPMDGGPWCVTATTATHLVVDLEAWVAAPPA